MLFLYLLLFLYTKSASSSFDQPMFVVFPKCCEYTQRHNMITTLFCLRFAARVIIYHMKSYNHNNINMTFYSIIIYIGTVMRLVHHCRSVFCVYIIYELIIILFHLQMMPIFNFTYSIVCSPTSSVNHNSAFQCLS